MTITDKPFYINIPLAALILLMTFTAPFYIGEVVGSLFYSALELIVSYKLR